MANETKYFTREEVSKHNTENDCWVIINDSVYDVTTFLQDHPGGIHAIMTNAGKDATDDFSAVKHSSNANTFKEEFLVGKLREN